MGNNEGKGYKWIAGERSKRKDIKTVKVDKLQYNKRSVCRIDFEGDTGSSR